MAVASLLPGAAYVVVVVVVTNVPPTEAYKAWLASCPIYNQTNASAVPVPVFDL